MKLSVAAPLILDFDIEARPLSFLGNDFVTSEVTAVAACFVGKPRTLSTWLLGEVTPEEILDAFRSYYDRADMVTGHYIRGYDLPHLNGALIELGQSPLEPKLSSDTKLDLLKRSRVSASQESLAAMLGIGAPKITMTQADWREANRLTPRGLALTRRRVEGDVKQHMELRAKLIELGWLGPPKVWTPRPGGKGGYVP
jgi:hypothetical protein